MIGHITNSLRKYLITGILVSLPLVVTIYVLWFVFSFLDNVFGSIVEMLIGHRVPGVGTVLTLALLVLVGMFGANVLGRRLIEFAERIFLTIPLVRSIYNTVKQIIDAFSLQGAGGSFQRVVLVQYPRPGMYSIAFVTNDQGAKAALGTDDELLTVFVPTVPNPTSGFVLMVPKSDAIPLDLTVEQAFKFIFSGGILAPARVDAAER